jgi:hypothetical protein
MRQPENSLVTARKKTMGMHYKKYTDEEIREISMMVLRANEIYFCRGLEKCLTSTSITTCSFFLTAKAAPRRTIQMKL